MFMRCLKRVMFDMDDAADDEVDDGLQQRKCPDNYSPEVWAKLSLKEQVVWYDNGDAQGVAGETTPAAAAAAASTGGVGGGGFRAGDGAVGGANIPMSRSDSRSAKRVTAPLAASLAATILPGAPAGASRSAPKARASYKQSDADLEFTSIITVIYRRFYALLLST